MADVVSEMQAQEVRSGVYPKGAGPNAVAEYGAWVDAHPDPFPTTPAEANDFWARYEREHPGAVVSAREVVGQPAVEGAKRE